MSFHFTRIIHFQLTASHRWLQPSLAFCPSAFSFSAHRPSPLSKQSYHFSTGGGGPISFSSPSSSDFGSGSGFGSRLKPFIF